jgi:hypothetical protein
MNLHYPDLDPRPDGCCALPRRPVAVWMLLALIGAILGVALVAASLTPDTRTFAQRHHFVPTGARAL